MEKSRVSPAVEATQAANSYADVNAFDRMI